MCQRQSLVAVGKFSGQPHSLAGHVSEGTLWQGAVARQASECVGAFSRQAFGIAQLGDSRAERVVFY